METSEGSSSSSVHSSDNPDISKLTEAVSETGSFEDHLALIDALSKHDDLDALRKARQSFALSHPLPEPIWAQWISDEQELAVTPEDQTNLLNLATQAVFDCPTVSLCALRLEINLSLCKANHPKADVVTVFNDALWLGAAANFKEGHCFWKEYGSPYSMLDALERPPLDIQDSDQTRECRIFEERLKTASSEEAVPNEDYIVSVFLSYASYVANVNTHSAVSVYERCVQLYKSNHTVWSAYYKFCTSVADADRRYYTARRATRACPDNLKMWSHMTHGIVDATPRFVPDRIKALTNVIGTVRPFVMQSNELRDASHLCISIWMSFQALGAPKEALECVKSSLSFNVSGTTEWASALNIAAAVCMKCNYRDDGVQLFEQVIAGRGQEARWWLAYASCIGQCAPDTASDIFSRASAFVLDGVHVDLIEDAWLTNEVKRGKEGLAERTSIVLRVMEERRAKMNKPTFEESPKPREKRLKRQGGTNKQDAKRSRRDATSKKHAPLVAKGPGPNADMDIVDVHDQHEEPLKERENGRSMKSNEKGSEKDVLMSESVKQVKDEDDLAQKRSTNEGEVEPRTIYLNNIPFQAGEKDVRDAFEFAGKIADVRLPRRSDGASKGIAYVEFEEDASVDRAVENRNAVILGRSVWVRRSQPRPRKGKQKDYGGTKGTSRKSSTRTSRPERVQLDDGGDGEKGESKLENSIDVQSKTQEDFRAMFLGTGKGK